MTQALILNQLQQSCIFDLQIDKIEMFLNLLMILGSLYQLHGLQMLQILLQRADLSQLSNFRIVCMKNKQEEIVTKQKPQPIRSIMLDKTRTNKRMAGKILEQRSCRYDTEWAENFGMSRSSFFFIWLQSCGPVFKRNRPRCETQLQ